MNVTYKSAYVEAKKLENFISSPKKIFHLPKKILQLR